MGAANSTRKITLMNDDKAGVIKLSESLAHRLRGQLESTTENVPVAQSEENKPISTQSQETMKNVATHDNEVKSGGSPYDSGPSWAIYAKEAHLMAARMREEMALKLKAKDHEWRNRLKEKEREYAEIAGLSEDHLTKTAKEVEGLFMRVSCSPVCRDQQEMVAKCYQDHPQQSLRCADYVNKFARCVDLSRLENLMEGKVS